MNSIEAGYLSQLPPGTPTALGESGASQESFKDLLLRSMDEVHAMQQQADRQVESLATGGDVSPAEVMTAVRKADLAFKTMMQVRNKLLQAYQEVRDVRI